ncbi:MAG: hypothetical protein Q4C96_11430 [Planctomycetia bacterium]|nr:hypothetical protein [Planctomycetia bacterium]
MIPQVSDPTTKSFYHSHILKWNAAIREARNFLEGGIFLENFSPKECRKNSCE